MYISTTNNDLKRAFISSLDVRTQLPLIFRDGIQWAVRILFHIKSRKINFKFNVAYSFIIQMAVEEMAIITL